MDFDSEPEPDTSSSSSPEEESELWKTNSRIRAKKSKSRSTNINTVMKVQVTRTDGKKYKITSTGNLLAIFKTNGIKQNLSRTQYHDLKHTGYLIGRQLRSRSIRFEGLYDCINKPWTLDYTDPVLVPPIYADHYVPWCSSSSLDVDGRHMGFTTNKRIPMIHIDGHAPTRGNELTLIANNLYLIGGVGLKTEYYRSQNAQIDKASCDVEIEVAVKSTWFSSSDKDCTSWRLREDVYAKSRSDPGFLFRTWGDAHTEFADMEVEFKRDVLYWGLHVKQSSQMQIACVKDIYVDVVERIKIEAGGKRISLEGVEWEWKSDTEGAHVAVSFKDCENRVALFQVLHPMAEIYKAATANMQWGNMDPLATLTEENVQYNSSE